MWRTPFGCAERDPLLPMALERLQSRCTILSRNGLGVAGCRLPSLYNRLSFRPHARQQFRLQGEAWDQTLPWR